MFEADRPFRTLQRLIDLRRSVVRSVAPDAPLTEATAIMAAEGLDALVVVDAEGGLRGILAARDVAAAALRRPDTPARDLKVENVMDPAPPLADPTTLVPEALAMLPERGPDHVVVVAEGRVVDLVSRTLLLQELVFHHTEVIREIRLQWRLMHLKGVYSC